MSKSECLENQKIMCHNGFINATLSGLSKQLDHLRKDRFKSVEEWRKGGKSDLLWAIVEEIDKKIDLTENAFNTVKSHSI